MRHNVLKRNSTKSERTFYEILKASKIPFKHRWIVRGREVDFIIGNHAIEIDAHHQDVQKNIMLVEEGYIPIHLNSHEIGPYLVEWISKLYGRN